MRIELDDKTLSTIFGTQSKSSGRATCSYDYDCGYLLPIKPFSCCFFSFSPGSEVQLLEYEASAAGLIRSFSERFSEDGPELEEVLTQLATADARFWKSPSEAPSGQA